MADTDGAGGWLDITMVTGRYSAGLARELDAHISARTLHFFQVLDEIAVLEKHPLAKPSITKRAGRFKGRWLNGLWKKHFMQPAYIAQNVALHWANEEKQQSLADVKPEQRLHHVFIEGYAERARRHRLTGQYIVFAKQDGANYYLTLGTHRDDEAIWIRCKACASEFPNLHVLQEDRN